MAISATALRALADGLAGSVVLPDDPQYASVPRFFAGRPDEPLPAAVARCVNSRDVVHSLRWAQVHNVPIALRSGGNSMAGWSSTSGLLIELSQLDNMQLDEDVLTAGPGVRVGALTDVLACSGRILPCGWYPRLAFGLILGGGFGVFSRLYGLGCDHLIAAEVVLFNGKVVWCDSEREPDLFWALRGAGGGLFGAVTTFVLRTQPVTAAVVFECRWPYRQAARVINDWLRWSPEVPAEINAELALTATDDPHEDAYVTLFGVSVNGTRFLADLDPAPEFIWTEELSGVAAARHHFYPGESTEDVVITGPPPGARPGLRLVRSEFFINTPPPDAVAALADWFVRGRVRGEYRDLEFVPWGGAISRVPTDATAFVHRGHRFLLRHTVQVGPMATDERRRAAADWVNQSWAITHPWGTGMVYPNYPEPSLPPWSPAYHGTNLPQLLRIRSALAAQ